MATHRYHLRHPLIILTCLYMSLSESVTLENSSLHGEPALLHGGSTQPLTHNDDESDVCMALKVLNITQHTCLKRNLQVVIELEQHQSLPL